MKRFEIHIGWLCNNNCLICTETQLRKLYTDTEFFIKKKKDIIDEMESCREKGYDWLTFTGGEPTIRPDFIEIVKISSKMNFKKISLATNGRLISMPDYAEKLVNSGIDEFGISIHGHNSRIHDSVTRTKGSFQQTVKALQNLKILGVEFFTSSVINRMNYKSLPDLISFLVSLGLERIFFSFLVPPDPVSDKKRYNIITPFYSQVVPYLHKALEMVKTSNLQFTIANMPYCLMSGFEEYKDDIYWEVQKNGESRFIKKGPSGDLVFTLNSGKHKYSECANCLQINKCFGISNLYLRSDKNEFPAII